MCREHEEIQSLLVKIKEGNYIAIKNEVYIVNNPNFYWLEKFENGRSCKEWVSYYWESDNPHYYGNKGTWLPTQDQLQEIYMKEYKGGAYMWQVFCNWLFMARGNDEYVNHFFDSGEQLWLAFVTEKIFNKIWDGEKWIEEKKVNEEN